MAEAIASATTAEAAPRKGGVKRLLLPIVLLLAGAAAGVAGSMFAPALLPAAGPEKPPAPKVAPLEYVEIENSFTANMKDTGRFVQVKIAVSTQGGAPVVEAVKRHQVAIVSAVLGVLAEAGEADLNAPGGREALAKRMRVAINDVLQRKSGIAGIDDVFLTSFLMQ
ncbi:flagellar basal body-associated FliL family protein [Sandaracinobacter sp. RS1-74]|uniref:flagellar basal body-associated FliL family protein n=1 Tax=Sandaracinobacteroides sayramensis TaxID=2913411 RepID=UPI001EDA282C|nr:flagellar basal body-associated FliL family protein [Sandaracinobacteroides sayramensis]MCG2841959.1 flagellar basal body-associated FliL family protein [Sandaracinobacteroides sayramensis]